MRSEESKGRNIAFDLLRIIAAFSVVVLLVSGVFIDRSPVGSLDFRLSNFVNSISRFGVPIFVMISGAIFLSEEKMVTIKKLWSKNILRMFIVFGVWSFAYYVYESIFWWKFDFWRHGIVRTITGCVYASDHFYDYGLVCTGTIFENMAASCREERSGLFCYPFYDFSDWQNHHYHFAR